MRRDPLESVTNEFIFVSPAIPCVSCSSYLDGLRAGGRWPYSCCFVGCFFLDLVNIAYINLVQSPSSFFYLRLASVHVVHPYSRIDKTSAWKKLHFILWDRSDFHVIDNPWIAIHAFTRCMLIQFSVTETLLPKYVNLSADFRTTI